MCGFSVTCILCLFEEHNEMYTYECIRFRCEEWLRSHDSQTLSCDCHVMSVFLNE